MSNIPEELKYTASHEWVKMNDDGTVSVGLTEHAQELLGDIVFVETPEIETEFAAEEACCVVESVKAASDVYMPISGEIVDTNGELTERPEIINSSPYDDGWIFKIKPSNEDELEGLMDAQSYEDSLED
ncbi:MAG: glycine cleavage system protein GcvH [Gammaproteobacteria bacterium]|nr:glycine cleavage system protein GcvH [Gammaproteobacteria bacterium]